MIVLKVQEFLQFPRMNEFMIIKKNLNASHNLDTYICTEYKSLFFLLLKYFTN